MKYHSGEQDTHWERDAQFQAYGVKEAAPYEDGSGWTLTLEDGGCIGLPNTQCQVQPQPGETARLYGEGFGYSVRGIVIEGRVYRYRTEAEEQADHAAEVERRKQESQATLEREREDRDQRRASLPPAFRERIEGFIAARDDWRRDHESYELFVCEEATKIIGRFGADVEAIGAFRGSTHEQQREALPEMSDGHSGNTFGAAVNLAMLHARDASLVPKQHGALCPLVGCQEYGCFAARAPVDAPRPHR